MPLSTESAGALTGRPTQGESSMKIKMLRTSRAEGKHVYKGEVYDVPKDLTVRDAKILLGIKAAVIVKEARKAKTEPKPKPKSKQQTARETKEAKTETRAKLSAEVFASKRLEKDWKDD